MPRALKSKKHYSTRERCFASHNHPFIRKFITFIDCDSVVYTSVPWNILQRIIYICSFHPSHISSKPIHSSRVALFSFPFSLPLVYYIYIRHSVHSAICAPLLTPLHPTHISQPISQHIMSCHVINSTGTFRRRRPSPRRFWACTRTSASRFRQ